MLKVLSSHRRKARITHPNGDFIPLADKSPLNKLEDLFMGYVHSFYQVKSVPNDQWLLLTTQVANVFLLTQNRHIPGYLDPTILCTADGKYPLLKPSDLLVEGLDGQPAIAFNV